MSSKYGYLYLFIIMPVFAADPLDVQEIDVKADSFRATNTGAMPVTYEDEILIHQIGVANYARSEQFGVIEANASIKQTGNNNASGTYQADGINNQINLNQQGNSNFALISQSGDINSANINQLNDNNRLSLDQQGANNTANIDQFGNSSLIFNQTGDQTANITLSNTAQGTITQISPTLTLDIQN